MDYPLHRMIWRNDTTAVSRLLIACKGDKDVVEKNDPRGRTPLLLAIILRRIECVNLLLSHGANCLAVDKHNWSAMDEATTSGDPDLLRLVLQYRQYQLLNIATDTVPKVLEKLKISPDFYVEMAWSFSTWIPFVSHLLPSDTYKIWKSANAVRVDTTLLGFENRKWKRGRLSLIFRLGANCAEIVEVNHDAMQYSISKVEIHKPPASPNGINIPPDELSFRLTSPVTSSYIDMDAISFERAKTGTGLLGSILAFGDSVDKVEDVCGYECKVYTASDVRFISQKRTEHLHKEDKKPQKGTTDELPSGNPSGSEGRLASILSAAVKRSVEVEERTDDHKTGDITEEEYFNEYFDMGRRFIGKPREITTKMQRFHATLWMSDKFPLSLQDQILPIIDLLAQRHSHVKKLREFITVHLPAGFPVKIDLPLYYVLTATVLQTNVHATMTPVEGVHSFKDDTRVHTRNQATLPAYETTFCAIDESVFEVPQNYRQVEDIARGGNGDFLSSTVEATLDSHTSTAHFGERLASTIGGASTSPTRPSQHLPATNSFGGLPLDEEAQMQLALAMSLQASRADNSDIATDTSLYDQALQAALAASMRDVSSSEDISAQEEADMRVALALSMKEK